MALLAPQLVELSLILAVMSFAAVMMGIGGADMHDFRMIRNKMAQSDLGGFAYLKDNDILTVDLLVRIAGTTTFFAFLVGTALAVRQWPKRRGENTGRQGEGRRYGHCSSL